MEVSFHDDESGPSLVAVRENFEELAGEGKQIIFATISPNPNVKIPVTRRFNGKKINAKMPYGKLPQRNQYEYCIRMLRSAYNYSHEVKIYGTWELNKSGNVHLHLLFYDPNIQSKTELEIFRRDVLNSELVLKNLSKKLVDYCNNIVYVNDGVSDRLLYMDKDHNCGRPFPYYTVGY